MMPSIPPSTSTGEKGQDSRITVAVAEQGGTSIFRLTFRGETVPLIESGSLNRWAAIGIIDRHKIVMMSDGVTVDGRHVSYADPQGPATLEHIFNRPVTPTGHTPPPAARAGSHATTAPAAASGAEDFAEHVRVTRDGFEFHVVYQTRFGQNKTEKLDAALESFQTMRAFKPHVNMQKSGIRLVVTRWDGENFIEEPGIENVEHATPDQIEALIRRNLQGGSEAPAGAAPVRRGNGPRHIIRLELVQKPHDARFHLVFHRLNGTVDEGPVLIASNMAKLAAEGIFRPDVSISMTVLNDRIVVARKAKLEGQSGVERETLPLRSEKEAKAIEAILNECLKPVEEPPPAAQPLPAALAAATAPEAPVVAPASVGPIAEPQKAPPPALPTPLAPPASARLSPPPPSEAVAEGASSEPARSPAPPPTPPAVRPPSAPAWLMRALKGTDARAVEEINTAVFRAVHRWFERLVQTNEHDLPAFTLNVPDQDGTAVGLEFVLGAHYLLCAFPFGYLRFGSETRVFLNRLADYIVFPSQALRGAVEGPLTGALTFLVAREFSDFLERHADRNYRTQFGEFLTRADQLKPGAHVFWPLSVEEGLFETVAVAAAAYGLPVTRDTVILAPQAEEFIGFKRVAPHGMEFRQGEDFVRFTPDCVEHGEDGRRTRFEAEDILRGWALDQEGRVCALYRNATEFAPPLGAKLVRFLNEEEAEAERASLTMLAGHPR